MKLIQAKDVNGYQMPPVKVDDEDYEYLKKKKWFCKQSGNTAYYYTHNTKSMHKTILIEMYKNEIPYGFNIHHIDGDGLNNQKNNLDIITIRDNLAFNYQDRDKYESKYMGVGRSSRKSKLWLFRINFGDKRICKQGFLTEEMAAVAKNYCIDKNNFPIPKNDVPVLSSKDYKKMIEIYNKEFIKTSRYLNISKRKKVYGKHWLAALRHKNFKLQRLFESEREALSCLNEFIIQNKLHNKYPIQEWKGDTDPKEKILRIRKKNENILFQ